MTSTVKLTGDSLEFAFPDVHPGAKMSITLQRTLRIPDDGKDHSLPPGLGHFPLRRVDDFKDRVPAGWVPKGGAFLPMYQAEAMWIAFHAGNVERRGQYPFAVKIAAGMRSAVTGEEWRAGLQPKDYVILPRQPWLDGFATSKGKVAQFVAVPLGMGFTAEEQLSGKAEHGGIQIEVFPMRREAFERRFPEQHWKGIVRSRGLSLESASLESCSVDMGLGAGGSMRQEIYEDPFDFADWDTSAPARMFLHIANSLAWRAITNQDPPTTPPTAEQYTKAGLPWFDYYRDDWKALEGSGKLANLKTVLQMGFQKGFSLLPENAPADVKPEQIVHLGNKVPAPDEVRQGW